MEEIKPQETIASQLERIEKLKSDLVVEREKSEKALNDLRELRAKEILGGLSSAGQQQQPKPEIDPREYARNALKARL